MSTKTSTIKRIALVAVAALGLGMVSTVSANAALSSTNPLFAPNGSTGTWVANSTYSVYTGTHTASTGGYVQFDAQSSITGATTLTVSVTGSSILSTTGASLNSYYDAGGNGANVAGKVTGSTFSAGTITDGSQLLAADIDATTRTAYANALGCTGSGTTATLTSADAAFTTVGASVYKWTTCPGSANLYIAKAVSNGGTALKSTNASFKVSTATAGAITVTLTANEISGGVSQATLQQTFNLTVFAGAVYQTSTVVLAATGNGALSAEATPVVYAPKAAGVSQATITVTHTPATPALYPAVTVALSGVGTLYDGTTTGGYLAYTAGSTVPTIYVKGDGRAGVATITVTAGSNVVGTKTVKFYGKAAKVTATGLMTVAKAGGGALGNLDGAYTDGTVQTFTIDNDPAIAVLVTDELGTPIPALAAFGVVGPLTMTSSNGAVISGTMTEWSHDSGGGIYSAGVWMSHVAVSSASTAKSGQTANVTFSVINTSDASVITSAPVAMSIGGGVASLTLSVDNTSYQPGEKGYVTVTAKDSSGNPVYDEAPLFAPYGISTTTSFGSLGLTTATVTVGGTAKKSFFAPIVPGTFTIKAVLADGVTTATVDVVVSKDTEAIDAANEATDAANAATDAANAAAEAADAATAAAQDAQAAVAALATQVAALIAAIKAQITSLTNLVIKIQKKLKA